MKNNCISKKKMTLYYYDEIMDLSELRNIKEHIKNCPKCSKHYQDMRDLSRIVDNIDKGMIINKNEYSKTSLRIKNRFSIYISSPILRIAALILIVVSIYLTFILFNNDVKNDNLQIDYLASVVADTFYYEEQPYITECFFELGQIKTE